MQVKRTLDQALIKAKVPFLFWCYATELLRDAAGKPAGVVISTRSGRQAVFAKVIIDATERGNVARMAGAAFTEYPAGIQRFTRVVVGGAPREGKGLRLRPRRNAPDDHRPERRSLPGARVRNSSADAQRRLRRIRRGGATRPGPHVVARGGGQRRGSVPGAAGSFPQPADLCGAVAGRGEGAAGMFPAGEGGENIRPRRLCGCVPGSRGGVAASGEPDGVRRPDWPGGGGVGGQGAETRRHPRSRQALSVNPARGHPRGRDRAEPSRGGDSACPRALTAVPVVGEYDVVVVGGGTGGAPAGIAAGRQGARTLLIEYLHGLGGVGTMGYIASYYHGNRVGFSTEVDKGVAAYGEKIREGSWNPEHKGEWFRGALRKAGVDVWYGVLGQGVVMDGQRVIGVVVLTPHGRGVVLAKTVVDSTGNADIAAAAGATCRYTDATDVAVQGTGLPPRELGQKYTNTDYTFVDDTDVFDIWRVLVTARMKFQGAYDLGQLIDTRERRQIVGDFFFSPMDMVLRRTFPDTIVIARSNFDTHGYIIHPMFMIRPPDRDDIDVRVPWRCLLPRGLDGVIVTGLGVSAHRDALPCIRMQADIQNQGYAAGVAAAMDREEGLRHAGSSISRNCRSTSSPSAICPRASSGRRTTSRCRRNGSPRPCAGWSTTTTAWRSCWPSSTPPNRSCARPWPPRPRTDRLIYAHILGMMGDGTGAEVLADAVNAKPWDKGWRYTGMGQFGPCMSPLDSLLIALGRTKSPVALKPILEKVGQLGPNSEFSHFRAVAMALETLADKSAAQPLAELLQKPGLGGHAVTTIDAALEANPAAARILRSATRP